MEWLYSTITFSFDTPSGELGDGEYAFYEANEGKNVLILDKGELVHRMKNEAELQGLKEVKITGDASYHVFKSEEGVFRKKVEKSEYNSLIVSNEKPIWQ